MSFISLWLLKVMNDVWEGNNASQALKKKKKVKANKVMLDKLKRKKKANNEWKTVKQQQQH